MPHDAGVVTNDAFLQTFFPDTIEKSASSVQSAYCQFNSMQLQVGIERLACVWRVEGLVPHMGLFPA